MDEAALQGTTVLELSEGTAGPDTGRLLAAYGAEVIKVEPPAGDLARRAGPFPGDLPDPERSGLFLYLNSDKQGITLALAHEGARAIVRPLIEQVDVRIESFAPGALEALGLGYRDLEAINPGIILVSVTPF